MKRLSFLKAKNGLGRFAPSALPHYYVDEILGPLHRETTFFMNEPGKTQHVTQRPADKQRRKKVDESDGSNQVAIVVLLLFLLPQARKPSLFSWVGASVRKQSALRFTCGIYTMAANKRNQRSLHLYRECGAILYLVCFSVGNSLTDVSPPRSRSVRAQ